jgi:hypothetical protein
VDQPVGDVAAPLALKPGLITVAAARVGAAGAASAPTASAAAATVVSKTRRRGRACWLDEAGTISFGQEPMTQGVE